MDIKSTACTLSNVDNGLLRIFGERVRMLRNKRGLSQEKFAALCQLDRTYISGIERGRRNPSVRNISRIAKVLDVSLSQLFKGVE